MVAGAGNGGRSLSELAHHETALRQLVASLQSPEATTGRTVADVVGALVATAHARDHEAIGHSFRVARYATALAAALGVHDEAALRAIEWGGLLHDVGKIAVPDEILRKAGPLDDEERAVLRTHPRRGYQMLRGLVFLGTALDIVLSHHERWDGTGYPNGLAGEEIPLAARIFAVVDTYDAITSRRPYRPARPHAAAVRELRRVAGSQLDPRLVSRFLDLPADHLARLRALEVPELEAPEPRPEREADDGERAAAS